MSSRHTSITLGEVQDLLQNLNRLKNFYHRQIACTSASIREHEKVERQLNADKKTSHNTKYDCDRVNHDKIDVNCLRKKQKINNRIKIRVKSADIKKK